jgi:hypothetical protein
MTGSEREGEETNGLCAHLFFQVRSVSPDRKRDWETLGFLSIFYAIFLEKDAHKSQLTHKFGGKVIMDLVATFAG